MKYWKTLTIFALMAFVIVSCDDKSSNNEPEPDPKKNANYYPSGDASYWVYENHVVKSNEGEIADIAAFDSVYVSDVKRLTEYTQYTHTAINDFTEITDTVSEKVNLFRYNSEEMELRADLLYLLPESNTLLNGIKNTIGSYLGNFGFVKIADFDAPIDETWELMPMFESDSAIAIPGTELKLGDVKYKIIATVSPSEAISFEGKDLTCEVMTITHDISGTVKISGFPVNVPVTLNIKNYYADGYGLVRTIMEPIAVSLGTVGYDISDGMNTYLIRHNIVNDAE